MPRRSDEWVRDILDAADEVAEYVGGMDRDEFDGDLKTVRAVTYLPLSVGEAAKNLPEEYTRTCTDVDWRGWKAMRDVLAHRCFGVDAGALWTTATVDLPAIAARLAAPP